MKVELERSNIRLIEVLSRHLLGGTEQINGKFKSGYPVFGMKIDKTGLIRNID
jgi:hypothetical protein